jgi:tetratricopeptide (TPR) repeat protein
MTSRRALLSTTLLCCAVVVARVPAALASQRPERNDYADVRFTSALDAGLQDFYAERFAEGQAAFERALQIVPDNPLAIAFLDASAAHRLGALDAVVNAAEDAVGDNPKSYVNHLRLGFAYLFASRAGRDRTQDARDEFNAAVLLDPDAAGAHVGLGIMRFDDRSTNRSKVEFLRALRADPNDVLAREYLGELYQTDLHDPQRGLSYVIDIPNLVPQYADIDFHIGSLLSDLHQNDAAISYLQRGIALDRSHVGEAGQHGYTLIARIEINERRYADAKSELAAALAADVDTIYARTLLAKVRDAQPSPSPSPSPGHSTAPQ